METWIFFAGDNSASQLFLTSPAHLQSLQLRFSPSLSTPSAQTLPGSTPLPGTTPTSRASRILTIRPLSPEKGSRIPIPTRLKSPRQSSPSHVAASSTQEATARDSVGLTSPRRVGTGQGVGSALAAGKAKKSLALSNGKDSSLTSLSDESVKRVSTPASDAGSKAKKPRMLSNGSNPPLKSPSGGSVKQDSPRKSDTSGKAKKPCALPNGRNPPSNGDAASHGSPHVEVSSPANIATPLRTSLTIPHTSPALVANGLSNGYLQQSLGSSLGLPSELLGSLSSSSHFGSDSEGDTVRSALASALLSAEGGFGVGSLGEESDATLSQSGYSLPRDHELPVATPSPARLEQLSASVGSPSASMEVHVIVMMYFCWVKGRHH